MTSVHDVAAYIIQKTGNLSTMKLQKLCYYAQGWHLAWAGEPLFKERLEAWRMGPVSPDLYRLHAGEASVHEWARGRAANIDTPEAMATLDVVVDFYSPFSGFDLGQMTHTERPWLEAWEGVPRSRRGRAEIKTETMRQYFSERVEDDDDAAIEEPAGRVASSSSS